MQNAEEFEMRCPICHRMAGVRKIGSSKGVFKYFCVECCVEIHKMLDRGMIEVHSITIAGDLVCEKIIILL